MLIAGPELMQIAFGDKFSYDRVDLLIVTAGMGLYLCAATLNQAALARGQVRQAAVCWIALRDRVRGLDGRCRSSTTSSCGSRSATSARRRCCARSLYVLYRRPVGPGGMTSPARPRSSSCGSRRLTRAAPDPARRRKRHPRRRADPDRRQRCWRWGSRAALIADRVKVPGLLLFLGLGMLVGSEGIGGVEFDDAELTRTLGTIGLVLILFEGGLTAGWKEIRPVLATAISLGTSARS